MTDKTPILERINHYREQNFENNSGMNEAGGIAFLTVYMDNVPVNLTARASNPYDALASLKIAITLAKEGLGVTVEKNIPQAAAPVKSKVAEAARSEGNDAFADDFEMADVPPAPDGKTWLTVQADSIKILPQPDDKVTLEFYLTGKQYPVIKVNKWGVPEVSGLLRHVTSQDVSKAAEVRLQNPCTVYYLEGKESTTPDGKKFHWKNVSHVR